jgi:hypothetical protein
VFDAADDPQEDQMARGIQAYKVARERQRAIVTRMAQRKITEIDAE